MALRYRAQNASGERRAALDVMQWARAALPSDDDTVVSVARHQCGEGACESGTTLLLLRPDQPPSTVVIGKPIDTITESDVRAALCAARPLKRRRA